ncbi:MAG: DUF2955 domain-containing protein [Psychrobium sp.]
MPTDSRQLDIVRLVCGVMVSFTLAMLIAWPMAYLSTIATCILLASRKNITVVMALAVTVVVAMLVNVCYWLFNWLGNFPLTMLLGLFIGCYVSFYRAANGGSKIITLIAVFAIIMIPTSYNISPDLSWVVSKWLIINTLIGFMVTTLTILVVPIDPNLSQTPDNISLGSLQAHKRALELSLAVLPVIGFFWLTNSTDVLLLVFTTLFVHRLVESPSLRFQVTLGYLLANIAGGAVAVMAYELLVMSPNLPFMLALFLTCFTLLTLKAFSDEKQTVLAFTAVNSFVALMGATLLFNTSDSEVAYLDRLLQIGTIGGYLIIFFALYEWFTRQMRRFRRVPQS